MDLKLRSSNTLSRKLITASQLSWDPGREGQGLAGAALVSGDRVECGMFGLDLMF